MRNTKRISTTRVSRGRFSFLRGVWRRENEKTLFPGYVRFATSKHSTINRPRSRFRYCGTRRTFIRVLSATSSPHSTRSVSEPLYCPQLVHNARSVTSTESRDSQKMLMSGWECPLHRKSKSGQFMKVDNPVVTDNI